MLSGCAFQLITNGLLFKIRHVVFVCLFSGIDLDKVIPGLTTILVLGIPTEQTLRAVKVESIQFKGKQCCTFVCSLILEGCAFLQSLGSGVDLQCDCIKRHNHNKNMFLVFRKIQVRGHSVNCYLQYVVKEYNSARFSSGQIICTKRSNWFTSLKTFIYFY